MELFIKISKNGDMALENAEGAVQYVAKYNSSDFSGKVFDDLALSELITIRNDLDGFSVIAFDSPIGTFKKSENRFIYATENETYKIEQNESTFLLFADGTNVGSIKRDGLGFRLDVTGGLTPLMGFALVIVTIAAKSFESASAKNKKVTVPPKTELVEAKEENKSEAISEESSAFETTEKNCAKGSFFSKTISAIKRGIGGKKLLKGSKIGLIMAVIGIIGVIASITITNLHKNSLSELKEGQATRFSKSKARFVYDEASYSFEIPENFQGVTLNVYYTEKTETDKKGNKTTSLDKFYSSYPEFVDLTPLTVISFGVLIIGIIVYLLTAFGLLSKENFTVILKALPFGKRTEPLEDEELEENPEISSPDIEE